MSFSTPYLMQNIEIGKIWDQDWSCRNEGNTHLQSLLLGSGPSFTFQSPEFPQMHWKTNRIHKGIRWIKYVNPLSPVFIRLWNLILTYSVDRQINHEIAKDFIDFKEKLKATEKTVRGMNTSSKHCHDSDWSYELSNVAPDKHPRGVSWLWARLEPKCYGLPQHKCTSNLD